MGEQSDLWGIEGLARFEMDAAAACSAQLGRVAVPELIDRLYDMQVRHLRHIERLNGVLVRSRGTPQEIPFELEGAVLRDYRSVGAEPETGSALVSVQATEEALLEAYELEIDAARDPALLSELEALAGEVRGHLHCLGEALSHSWELSESAGATS